MRTRLVSSLIPWLTLVAPLALQEGHALADVSASSPGASSPGPSTVASSATSSTGSGMASAAAPDVLQRVAQGVVSVERAGRTLELGTILAGGEGRVLTALSPLEAQETLDVRYADGALVHAHVSSRDAGWDLALLVPEGGGKRASGLVPSFANPAETLLRAPVASSQGGHPQAPSVVPAYLRGVIDALALRAPRALPAVLDVDLHGATPSAGAPLLDATGGVLGIFVQACRPTKMAVPSSPGAAPPVKDGSCPPALVAAPVAAIRDFLVHPPPQAAAVSPPPAVAAPSASKLPSSPNEGPWLGIVAVADTVAGTRGVRVLQNLPDSPAVSAGITGSSDRALADLIVAVDNQPVETLDKLAEVIAHHRVGDRIRVLALHGVSFREFSVILKAAH